MTSTKKQKAVYKRILLKLSGEALLAQSSTVLMPKHAPSFAAQIKEVRDLGVQVALVVGGGNIFRGHVESKRFGLDQSVADYMGMLATVLNGLALQNALEQIDVPTRVMTALQMASIAEPYIRRRAMRHLEKGRVIIFVAGTGNPYFTTDTAVRPARQRDQRGCYFKSDESRWHLYGGSIRAKIG